MARRPTNAEARAFHTRFDNYGTALKAPEYGGPSAPSYSELDDDVEYKRGHPRYPDYHYPDDKEADTRTQMLLTGREFYGAQPTFQLGDREIDYLLKKKEARALLDFKQFVEDSIPRGTPWAKDYFEKIMPGWYQSKIDIINEKMDIVQKFIEISIKGPQSIDDMFLLYQIYQGNIAIPTSFENLIHGTTQPPAVFHAGLFNPKRFVSSKIMVSKRNQEFLANFAIPGIDMKGVGATAGAINGNSLVVAGDGNHWSNAGRGAYAEALGWQTGQDNPGGHVEATANDTIPRGVWSYRDGPATFGARNNNGGYDQIGGNTAFGLGSALGRSAHYTT